MIKVIEYINRKDWPDNIEQIEDPTKRDDWQIYEEIEIPDNADVDYYNDVMDNIVDTLNNRHKDLIFRWGDKNVPKPNNIAE